MVLIFSTGLRFLYFNIYINVFWRCSGLAVDVPRCPGVYHVLDFIDGPIRKVIFNQA